MNKTIEERAHEFVDSISATNTLMSVFEVYKHSAEEQRKIDIEKACEAYCKEVCQTQKLGKRCFWQIQNERCQKLESFVKVMEKRNE